MGPWRTQDQTLRPILQPERVEKKGKATSNINHVLLYKDKRSSGQVFAGVFVTCSHK